MMRSECKKLHSFVSSENLEMPALAASAFFFAPAAFVCARCSVYISEVAPKKSSVATESGAFGVTHIMHFIGAIHTRGSSTRFDHRAIDVAHRARFMTE